MSSSQPGLSWAAQQSPSPPMPGHSSQPSSTTCTVQNSSHATSQHAESRAHTQASIVSSPQPAPFCASQHMPPGLPLSLLDSLPPLELSAGPLLSLPPLLVSPEPSVVGSVL